MREHARAIDAVKAVSAHEAWSQLNTYIDADDFPGESTEAIMSSVGSSEGADRYRACKAYDVVEDIAVAIAKSFECAFEVSPSLATCERITEDLRGIGETFEQFEDRMRALLQPLADMTVVQAGLRDLGVHESRSSSAKKCRKGLAKRRYMLANPKLLLWLQSFEEH